MKPWHIVSALIPSFRRLRVDREQTYRLMMTANWIPERAVVVLDAAERAAAGSTKSHEWWMTYTYDLVAEGYEPSVILAKLERSGR